MALVRCVTEMGMGVDVHGLDYTAAAKRAVFDAIHHSSLGFPRLIGKTADDMHVEVTIGVPKPDAVDKQAVLETLRPEDRQVLTYRYFLDLSEAEMAAALGCARGTVKSRLSRALGRLRALLVPGRSAEDRTRGSDG